MGLVVGPFGGCGVTLEFRPSAVAALEQVPGDGCVGIRTAKGQHLGEGGCLDALEPRKLPARLRHLLQKKRLVLANWPELLAQTGEHRIEFFLFFVRQDSESSGESMPGSVARGGGFALRRFRAGGELGITLISGDLSGAGSHCAPRISGEVAKSDYADRTKGGKR